MDFVDDLTTRQREVGYDKHGLARVETPPALEEQSVAVIKTLDIGPSDQVAGAVSSDQTIQFTDPPAARKAPVEFSKVATCLFVFWNHADRVGALKHVAKTPAIDPQRIIQKLIDTLLRHCGAACKPDRECRPRDRGPHER
jgi:hypothetical protein